MFKIEKKLLWFINDIRNYVSKYKHYTWVWAKISINIVKLWIDWSFIFYLYPDNIFFISSIIDTSYFKLPISIRSLKLPVSNSSYNSILFQIQKNLNMAHILLRMKTFLNTLLSNTNPYILFILSLNIERFAYRGRYAKPRTFIKVIVSIFPAQR